MHNIDLTNLYEEMNRIDDEASLNKKDINEGLFDSKAKFEKEIKKITGSDKSGVAHDIANAIHQYISAYKFSNKDNIDSFLDRVKKYVDAINANSTSTIDDMLTIFNEFDVVDVKSLGEIRAINAKISHLSPKAKEMVMTSVNKWISNVIPQLL